MVFSVGIQFFYDFFSFSLTWDPMGVKNFMGKDRLLLLGELPKIQQFMILCVFLLTQGHKGLEISKRYSYSFHPMTAKFHEDVVYHGGLRLLFL